MARVRKLSPKRKELIDNLLAYYQPETVADAHYSGGLKIYRKDKINEMFLESVLKYNSFVEFIFVNSKIIITPTDHMDIFFNTSNNKKMEINLKKIVANHFKDIFEVKSL